MASLKLETEEKKQEEEEVKRRENETSFIAFARVFSGSLVKGREVFILGPKYDPGVTLAKVQRNEEVFSPNANVKTNQSELHLMKTTLQDFYLLLGREMEELDEVRNAWNSSIVCALKQGATPLKS